MADGHADPTEDATEERLLWFATIAGRERRIDLLPSATSRVVHVAVDGHRVATLKGPSKARPWSEVAFAIDGVPLAVGLALHEFSPRTDVFVSGRSIRDGQSLDAVRARAPQPAAGYELWFDPGFRLTRGSLAPGWATLLLLGGIAVVVVAGLIGAAGPIPAAAVAVGLASGTVGWLWYWMASAVAVHRWLLRHPGLGDLVRGALLVGAFAVYPIATLSVVAGLRLLGSRGATY